jgi:putative aldouronate transport system substrate-binding protein
VQYAGFNPYSAFSNATFMITDKATDPDLAFKWADSLGHIEVTQRSIFGVLDRDWAWAKEGEKGIDGEQAWWRSITDIANVPTQNAHWSQMGPTFRSTKTRLSQYVSPEAAPNDVEVILFNQTKDKYEPYKQPSEMTLPPLYFSPDQAQTVAELTPTIQAYVDQTFAQAVTGQIDIEQVWTDYITTLGSMGLDNFISMHQTAVDANKG